MMTMMFCKNRSRGQSWENCKLFYQLTGSTTQRANDNIFLFLQGFVHAYLLILFQEFK